MKNILVILGHPRKGSFCEALANEYVAKAKTKNSTVELVELSDLIFDKNFLYGPNEKSPLENDLVKMQEKIKNADHIVWVYPIWWGDTPALLKAFIDRTLLPNFAFKYKSGFGYPDKLLTGKTAELIVTMDAPIWYYKLFLGSPGIKIMKRDILAFCGIKVVKTYLFGPIKGSTAEQRAKWLRKIE